MKNSANKSFPWLAHFIILLSLVLIMSSCSKKTEFVQTDSSPQDQAKDPKDEVDIDKLNGKCIQVFYDSSADPMYKFGRIHGLMLTNLLGHFPQYQRILGPIENYKKNNLDRCMASFYIGSVYNNSLPQDFLNDFKTTNRQVVWLGYNFWQLGADFENIFGYKDYIFTTLDYTNLTTDGKPGFFRDVLYKGEVFTKFSTWISTPPPATSMPAVSVTNPTAPVPLQTLVAPFEVTKLFTKTNDNSVTLAETRHSFTNEVIPWAIQAKNRFFVTESPFSFIHEADRYFVFADLLFDFLKEQPKHSSKSALLRLEDIHPMIEQNYLDEAVTILRRNSVVPHMTMIPVFRDPLFEVVREGDTRVQIRMEEQPNYMNLIQRYKNEGTVFIWHGVTHQYRDIKNPFTGCSGDDYEFWDSILNKPITEDSTQYVLSKLEDGFNSFQRFSIVPMTWVTPHYHGSALDNVLFGQIFKWIIGRGVYVDSAVSGLKNWSSSDKVGFSLNSKTDAFERLNYLLNVKVETDPNGTQFGQLFPYEIYGNIYNQNVIPENLGNVQPYLSNQVVHTRTVDMILADAKRNLVLRDVWASVFYHPFLLDPALNTENADPTKSKDLERLVVGLKSLGYQFVNIDSFAATATVAKAKAFIELESTNKK